MCINRMDYLTLLLTWAKAIATFSAQNESREEDFPKSRDPHDQMKYFTESLQIVRAAEIDVDERGRVWAVKSSTHFLFEGYQRVNSDQILVLSDQDGDLITSLQALK